MPYEITYHRVLHPKLGALKTSHGVMRSDAKVKDGVLFWPLPMARKVAKLFPSAEVEQTGLYAKDFQ
jgi:hypothetical protein